MAGGDRDGQRPRQSSGEGARAGETASRGRRSGEDREAAETMRATDTPDAERPRDLDRLPWRGKTEGGIEEGEARWPKREDEARGRSGEAGEPRRQ